ncbi:glycosyltransferase [Chryseobacterium sp. Leaf180]|uniref:DUF2062 domain-containing protein n=1 Tax=Chryseobacterium sp. Leaf180 TaxID=1736289 RepID=UPI0006F9EC89|nr:DUF2062 domain-containing protein [Chryseobacterium sp. Leaf180]KQR95004.1 glycosyltransferase [Chryseobacterium sp. Leaf180]
MEVSEVKNPFSSDKICIIIPAYNNVKTLPAILERTLKITQNIIVVNDGSKDSTQQILDNYLDIDVIHLPQNVGKGNALKLAFRHAVAKKYDFAVTLDASGQYDPEDLPLFFKGINDSDGKTVFVGQRDFSKKNFSVKLAEFWFWLETGQKLNDVNCGFRLYPLQFVPKKFFTPKFEFEIEILVRLAWKNLEIKNIPVHHHENPVDRISHFRPVKDVIRITFLNLILILITVFYVIPRNFIQNLRKKSFKRFIKEDVLASEGTNRTKAFSIAMGIFVGFSPFWGFHTLLVIGLSVVFKLNKVLAFVVSNVSLPPFIPFLFAASLYVGSPFVSQKTDLFSQELNFDLIKNNFVQYAIGSMILAVSLSALSFFISLFFLNKISPEKK